MIAYDASRFDWQTAGDLVSALARRDVTARALCDAAIDKIEARDRYNAVVVRDFERARAAAEAADRALEAGQRRPLLGLPMTVKESFDVAGLPSTWGMESGRGRIAHEDSACIARLKRAGAIILGKTNVGEALSDWQSVNPIYGRTTHPLDEALTPGGSSGGAAVAVATDLVALELGSDIGGSIRVPSSFCGLYGHKPTYGVVPTSGHEPPGAGQGRIELNVAGPIARSASDLKLALEVLASPDEHDVVRVLLPPPRREGLSGLRVLLLKQHPSAATSREIQAALEALAHRIAREGAQVSDASADLPDLAGAHAAYAKMLLAIISRGSRSTKVPTVHAWFDLLDRQEHVRRAWERLFRSFDVVLAPAFGSVAFAHVDEPDWSQRRLIIDGSETPYGAQLAWPGLATFPGLPATAFPAGQSSMSLPIGVQVLARPYDDLTCIEVAQHMGALVG
jgi:amidase